MLFKFLIALIFLTAPALAQADWFTSDETKALIVQADAGDANAQLRAGMAYDSGNGAPQDRAKAKQYYSLAAEQGLAEAQNSLGSILQAEKRYSEALIWYERSAKQRHSEATNSLANMYDLGMGVPQDRKKGYELYIQAADLGSARAMWNITQMYGAGHLGQVDMVAACTWAVRAERFVKDQDYILQRYIAATMPRFEKNLAAQDYDKCREQGNVWKPKDAITFN
jgi:TPR repeat protein